MQVEILLTKLFNAAVDKIFRNFLTIILEEAAGLEVSDHMLQRMDSFSYDNDGLITSMWPE